MWQLTRSFLALALAALVDHTVSGNFSGPLYAAYLGLYIAPTAPIGQSTPLSAITEATYAGYARQLIVWNPPYLDPTGPYTLSGGELFFAPSDGVTPNVITGIFLASAITAGVLYGAAVIPGGGYALVDTTSALPIVPLFQLPFDQVYGDPIVIQ